MTCVHLTRLPTDLAAAREVLRGRRTVPLEQPWLERPEEGFQPAEVVPFWTPDYLGVYGRLSDRQASNQAAGPNARTWEMGDVFEFFLRPLPGEAYWEFHVTPENQQLQLRFESEAFFRRRAELKTGPARWLEGIGLPAGSFESRTVVEPYQWEVLAWLPAARLGATDGGAWTRREWKANFCRYDADAGREHPIRSTTAKPLPKPDFHANAAWGRLRFENASACAWPGDQA